MLLLSAGFLLLANAATVRDMQTYCPDGYNTWNAVTASEWYWGDDWAELLAEDSSEVTPVNAYIPTVVNPAGFKLFNLAHYNEPPVCLLVPGSRDKKVEIMLESDLGNANLCIHDAKGGQSIGTNNVGSVANCGSGKIYACFTSATVEGQNFGFYVSCESGCEDTDMDIWVRIRVSDQSWDVGKTDTASDLEHWCERERGTNFVLSGVEDPDHTYYTYPSDLLPDEPSEYPFHIQQIFGRSAGSAEHPRVWLITAVTFFGLVALFA